MTQPPLDVRFEDAYRELRRLAHAQLGRHNEIFSTTELVHESYLKLAGSANAPPAERRQFLAYAGKVMRSVLVDAARARLADRRGGDLQRTTLNSQVIEGVSLDSDLLKVDEAVTLLEAADPQLARIVELRFYAGLTVDEVAEVLQSSPRSVAREWAKARLMLMDVLRGQA
jgi:RNA polymerase sigma factor (TIGR02999 family)